MSLKRFAAAAALAVVAMAGTTAASYAYDAYASVGLKVRSGAGLNYKQIGSLYAGQKVAVDHCEYNWCYISWSSYYGWVAQQYLADHYTPPKYTGGYSGGNKGGGYKGY